MKEKKTQVSKVPTPPFKSAFEAEQAFYLAFVRCDLELMKKVWSPVLSVSYCLHPNDQPLIGYADIIQSWADVFANQKLVKLQIEHKNLVSNPGIAVHRITEHISIRLNANTIQKGTFHALNVLQCVNDQWFMLSHHAAPAPQIEKPTGVSVH